MEVNLSSIKAGIQQKEDDRAFISGIAQYVVWWVVNSQRTQDTWIKIEDIDPRDFLNFLRNPKPPTVNTAVKRKQQKQREQWDKEMVNNHLGIKS